MVMVTHDLHQAKRVADHVVFLYLGEMIENGPGGPDYLMTRRKLGRVCTWKAPASEKRVLTFAPIG